jgi:hypothetical protein
MNASLRNKTDCKDRREFLLLVENLSLQRELEVSITSKFGCSNQLESVELYTCALPLEMPSAIFPQVLFLILFLAVSVSSTIEQVITDFLYLRALFTSFLSLVGWRIWPLVPTANCLLPILRE